MKRAAFLLFACLACTPPVTRRGEGPVSGTVVPRARTIACGDSVALVRRPGRSVVATAQVSNGCAQGRPAGLHVRWLAGTRQEQAVSRGEALAVSYDLGPRETLWLRSGGPGPGRCRHAAAVHGTEGVRLPRQALPCGSRTTLYRNRSRAPRTVAIRWAHRCDRDARLYLSRDGGPREEVRVRSGSEDDYRFRMPPYDVVRNVAIVYECEGGSGSGFDYRIEVR